jgi:hypothetical protein
MPCEFEKDIWKKTLENCEKRESDIRPTVVDSIEHYHEGFHRILRQIYIVCSFYFTTALALPFTAVIRIKVQLLPKLDSLYLTIIRFYYYFIKIQFL